MSHGCSWCVRCGSVSVRVAFIFCVSPSCFNTTPTLPQIPPSRDSPPNLRFPLQQKMVLVICGNKADLLQGTPVRAPLKRGVEKDVVMSYASEIGATYLEASAKDDTNINKIFEIVVDKLPPQEHDDDETFQVRKEEREGGCC